MRSTLRHLMAGATALGIAALATPAASRLAPPELSGTYVLDRRASDDPGTAVENATSSMRRRRRRAVDARLQEEMRAADTLRITQRGDSVVLAASGRAQVTVVAGERKSRTGQRGGTAEVAAEWQGDALVVRTTSERFQREVRYAAEEEGSRLRVAVSMRAERLSEPVAYTLVYRRVSAAGGSD